MPHSFLPDNDYKMEYIGLLEELSSLMYNKGDSMRGRAYSRAAEAISKFKDPINDPTILKKVPGIGKTMISKLW